MRVIPSRFGLPWAGRGGLAWALALGADGLGRVRGKKASGGCVVVLWILLSVADAAGIETPCPAATPGGLSGRRRGWGFTVGGLAKNGCPPCSPASLRWGDAVDSVGEAKRLDLRYAFDFGWVGTSNC